MMKIKGLMNKDNLNKYYSKINVTRFIKDFLFLLFGILLTGFGLKGFLLPNLFIDGGVTGVSLLISGITKISLSLLIVLINIPFILLGFKQINKSFAIKSIITIFGLSFFILLIDYPIITHDKLLVAVFGGFFVGAGMGLAIRGGAVMDGMDVVAIYLSRKTGLTIGDTTLIIDVIIFSAAAYLISIEIAMYSILIYFIASKTVDFIIEGIEEYIGVTIISNKSEAIRMMIIEKLGRGVTIYNGRSGYAKNRENLSQTDIVYSVITRLELSKLNTEIEKIDPNAFVVMGGVKDTKGGIIKKRPLKK